MRAVSFPSPTLTREALGVEKFPGAVDGDQSGFVPRVVSGQAGVPAPIRRDIPLNL
jgi:hypothetical protein